MWMGGPRTGAPVTTSVLSLKRVTEVFVPEPAVLDALAPPNLSPITVTGR